MLNVVETVSATAGDRTTLSAPTASRQRWWIVVLLFFATTLNYVDRQLFAILIPYFEDELRIGINADNATLE